MPALLLLAACGFLLLRGRLTAFLAGVCIALAAAARLPCIIGALLPWTIVALRRREPLNALLSNAGTLVTLGAIYVLTPYDPAIVETQKYWAASHGIRSLVTADGVHAIKVIVFTGVCWILMRRPAWLAGLGAALIPAVLLWPSPVLIRDFSLAGVAVVIAALLQSNPKAELLVLGLCAALAGCIGSNTGLWKMRYGLWLALPAAFLMLVERAEPRNRRAMWIAVAMLALLGGTVRWLSPYRDADRLQLTAAIDHSRLRDIFTSRSRASELQSLLRETEKRVRPGDPLLAFGSIPMLHFLTATRPALGYA